MITEKADANVAAVNYHFGSKEDLVRAVFMRRLREIDDMRMQRLDALEVGGREPDVEEITRAFMEPLIVQGISRETGKLVPFVVLIRQVFSDPEAGQKIMHSWEPPRIILRITKALAKATSSDIPTGPRAQLLMMLMHSATLEALYVSQEPPKAPTTKNWIRMPSSKALFASCPVEYVLSSRRKHSKKPEALAKMQRHGGG